ncbi:Holliday junction resolvase RuvX [bacterium]|jgi:putative Holliday junction resolvase|nr:Holliday junction resolvase RuvX [bacterium]NBW58245.1 Holliday junction resolvase RuvX [bacterium]NBX72536.1 Holliday junction resolvase RuvX [bacterium]
MNILGLDFGTKKIGISLGSSISRTARPLTILSVNDQLQTTLTSLIETWRIQRIVLGDPGDYPNNKNLNDSIDLFIKNILTPYNITIIRWTEEGSSQEAQSLLKEYPAASRDAIAAMLVLQSYLDTL